MTSLPEERFDDEDPPAPAEGDSDAAPGGEDVGQEDAGGEPATSAAEEARDSAPTGLPPADSTRRRALRPPQPAGELATVDDFGAVISARDDRISGATRRPSGLSEITTSARHRLELALEHDDSIIPPPPAKGGDRPSKIPVGLRNLTTSVRRRLELALEHDDSIMPPAWIPDAEFDPPRDVSLPPPRRFKLGATGTVIVRSLGRWVLLCGLLSLTMGALTGLSYWTGPGSVAHVVVGILASAMSIWLLAAAYSFRRVVTTNAPRSHLVNGLGLLRSVLLLKAILLFSTMVLGCFTFSLVTGLLLLL